MPSLHAELSYRDIDAELKEAVAYVGSEKLLLPWVTALISKIEKPRYLDVLNSLFSYTALPEVVVRKAVSSLLSSLIAADGHANARKALSTVQLVYSRIVEEVCTEAMKDEGERGSVEQIVLSLSLVRLPQSQSFIWYQLCSVKNREGYGHDHCRLQR